MAARLLDVTPLTPAAVYCVALGLMAKALLFSAAALMALKAAV